MSAFHTLMLVAALTIGAVATSCQEYAGNAESCAAAHVDVSESSQLNLLQTNVIVQQDDLSMEVPENKPDGVVCSTWLHPEIQEQNLKPFIEDHLANASGFLQKLEELCGDTGDNLMDGYTGSWDETKPKGTPSENDVRILKALTAWQTEERKKDAQAQSNQYSKKHHGQSTGTFVADLMDKPLPLTPRIMDFGCGSGADLKEMKAALQVQADADALCLDIFFKGSTDILGVTTIPLNATSVSSYKTSLDTVLTDASLNIEGTILVAISMVAFHHIADPADPQDPTMRTDALNFIRKSLAPGGIFIMADWDNSLTPNRWIHYDLVHWLPTMLFSNSSPSTPSQMEEGTQYLSVAAWRTLATHDDWEVNETQSKLPSGLSPENVAKQPGNADRDFHLVFRKNKAEPDDSDDQAPSDDSDDNLDDTSDDISDDISDPMLRARAAARAGASAD